MSYRVDFIGLIFSNVFNEFFRLQIFWWYNFIPTYQVYFRTTLKIVGPWKRFFWPFKYNIKSLFSFHYLKVAVLKTYTRQKLDHHRVSSTKRLLLKPFEWDGNRVDIKRSISWLFVFFESSIVIFKGLLAMPSNTASNISFKNWLKLVAVIICIKCSLI